jgi:hypothetical protein
MIIRGLDEGTCGETIEYRKRKKATTRIMSTTKLTGVISLVSGWAMARKREGVGEVCRTFF